VKYLVLLLLTGCSFSINGELANLEKMARENSKTEICYNRNNGYVDPTATKHITSSHRYCVIYKGRIK